MGGMLLAWAALLLADPALSEDRPVQNPHSNIVYGSYSGLSLLMDAHVPGKPNGFAILHIPGSGFQAPLGMEPFEIKDPRQHRALLAAFLAQGFTIFTINHRAAPRFPYPAPFEDAQRAARFIRANAGKFGVSPNWLGVVGGSSGGNLALMLGTRGEGGEGTARTPQCVVAVMAPTDLLPLGRDGPAVGMATQYAGTVAPFPEESALPGYAERTAPYREASPINFLGPRATGQFLLFHGDADRLVPMDQSTRFVAKAKSLGVEAEIRTMAGVGHNFPAPYPQAAARWMTACAQKTSRAANGALSR